MNELKYEFLSYEAFPDDQYVKEVVVVCFNGLLILPYQNVNTKNGGSFWCFPGMAATKHGEKKRFNGEFDSKSFKIKFENDLEGFIRSKNPSANSSHQQQSISPQKGQANAGYESQQLPF